MSLRGIFSSHHVNTTTTVQIYELVLVLVMSVIVSSQGVQVPLTASIGSILICLELGLLYSPCGREM